MTLETNLQQTEMEAMPELYHFWAGTYEERITSWRSNLIFQGNEYLARPIRRSGFTFDSNFGPVNVSIEAPLVDTFIAYISTQPIEPTHVKIYRAIYSDLSDYAVIFTGQLTRMGITQRMARAEFESKANRLRVRIPQIIYQSYCNWDVFDINCALLSSSFEVKANVSVVSDTLISPTFGTYASQYFRAGRVKFGDDERWVLDHTGNTITLQIPFDSRLTSGKIVTALPGCDGSPDTCKDKFNNFEHFMGFPYIPSHNPVLYGFK